MATATPTEMIRLAQAREDERERIIQILVREVAKGGLNGLDEDDIRELLESN